MFASTEIAPVGTVPIVWSQALAALKQKTSFLVSYMNKCQRIKKIEARDGIFFLKSNKNEM